VALHERGHAVVVDDAWVCALGNEECEDICCACSCCLNKRRAAMAVACVDICPAPNKRLGCAEVTTRRRVHERVNALSMARRDVRAAVREESNAVCVATSGSDDERGKTRLRNGIDTRACLYD